MKLPRAVVQNANLAIACLGSCGVTGLVASVLKHYNMGILVEKKMDSTTMGFRA